MKKSILFSIFLYISIRLFLLYFFSFNTMKSDVGESGAFLLFFLFVLFEIVFTSIPFWFKDISIRFFDRKWKIFIYYFFMLILNTLIYIFSSKNLNLADVWLAEIGVILLLILYFQVNWKLGKLEN